MSLFLYFCSDLYYLDCFPMAVLQCANIWLSAQSNLFRKPKTVAEFDARHWLWRRILSVRESRRHKMVHCTDFLFHKKIFVESIPIQSWAKPIGNMGRTCEKERIHILIWSMERVGNAGIFFWNSKFKNWKLFGFGQMNQTTDHPVPFGMYTSGLLFDRSKLLLVLEKIAKFDILIISRSLHCQVAFPMYGPGRLQGIWSGRSEIFVVSLSATEHDGTKAVIPCWKLRRLQTSSSYIGSTVREHVSHRLSEKILIRTRNFVGCRWDLRP